MEKYDVIVDMSMLSEGSIPAGCPVHSQVPCVEYIYLAEMENKSHKQNYIIFKHIEAGIQFNFGAMPLFRGKTKRLLHRFLNTSTSSMRTNFLKLRIEKQRKKLELCAFKLQ